MYGDDIQWHSRFWHLHFHSNKIVNYETTLNADDMCIITNWLHCAVSSLLLTTRCFFCVCVFPSFAGFSFNDSLSGIFEGFTNFRLRISRRSDNIPQGMCWNVGKSHIKMNGIDFWSFNWHRIFSQFVEKRNKNRDHVQHIKKASWRKESAENGCDWTEIYCFMLLLHLFSSICSSHSTTIYLLRFFHPFFPVRFF